MWLLYQSNLGLRNEIGADQSDRPALFPPSGTVEGVEVFGEPLVSRIQDLRMRVGSCETSLVSAFLLSTKFKKVTTRITLLS